MMAANVVLLPDAADEVATRLRATLQTSASLRAAVAFWTIDPASMGPDLVRNLSAAEILLQYFEVERITGEHITNIVYMGMGEPMLNYDNVVKSLRILTDPELEIIGVPGSAKTR